MDWIQWVFLCIKDKNLTHALPLLFALSGLCLRRYK
jgi:hypothetical protein